MPLPDPKSPEWPIKVRTGVSIFRVNEIRDTDETFTCRFALHLSWIDPIYKGTETAYSNHPEISDEKTAAFPEMQLSPQGVLIPTSNCARWMPEIKFFDTPEEPTVLHEYIKTNPENGVVTHYKEFVGMFDERLELQSFPFDCQLLSISFGSHHYGDRLQFVPATRPNRMLAQNLSDWAFISQEMDDDMSVLPTTMTYDPDLEPDKPTHEGIDFVTLREAGKGGAHSVQIQVRAIRLYGWYVLNVVTVLSTLGLVAALLPMAGACSAAARTGSIRTAAASISPGARAKLSAVRPSQESSSPRESTSS